MRAWGLEVPVDPVPADNLLRTYSRACQRGAVCAPLAEALCAQPARPNWGMQGQLSPMQHEAATTRDNDQIRIKLWLIEFRVTAVVAQSRSLGFTRGSYGRSNRHQNLVPPSSA